MNPVKCSTYRIYSNKRRGAYLIFRATSAAIIQGRHLFEGGAYLNTAPGKFTFPMFFLNGTLIVFLSVNKIRRKWRLGAQRQIYNWGATQPLQDGTTPVASSIHNPATSPRPNARTNKTK